MARKYGGGIIMLPSVALVYCKVVVFCSFIVSHIVTSCAGCRSRFKEARVLVFGSSAGQLATPESDIDLTVCLPTRAKLIHELKVCRTN